VDAKFRYRVKKSDKYAQSPSDYRDACLLTIIRKRSIIICANNECPFHIHAAWSDRKECVVVTSVQEMHTCLGSIEGQRGTNNRTKWLQRVLPELIVIKRNTRSQAIIEAVQLKYHVSVNKLSARRPKHALLGRSAAEFARQYQQLPAYLARFSATNPLTTYCLLVDEETQRFKRVFICPLASSISFHHMRGIVAVDGTFLKGSFVHTLHQQKISRGSGAIGASGRHIAPVIDSIRRTACNIRGSWWLHARFMNTTTEVVDFMNLTGIACPNVVPKNSGHTIQVTKFLVLFARRF